LNGTLLLPKISGVQHLETRKDLYVYSQRFTSLPDKFMTRIGAAVHLGPFVDLPDRRNLWIRVLIIIVYIIHRSGLESDSSSLKSGEPSSRLNSPLDKGMLLSNCV
jgi:hypothetical protein